MRGSDKSSQIKNIQLQATFTIVELAFNKTEAQNYAVEFNRGAQVYKMFSEVAWVHAQQKKYKYLTGESVTIKHQSGAPLKYEWTIYKLTDEDLKDFQASVEADISEQYNSLSEAMRRQSRQYNTLINSVHTGNIQQQWKELRDKLPFERKGLTAVNLKKGIKITYDLKFKCELDSLIQELHKLHLLKRHSKNQKEENFSGKNSGILKSQTEVKTNVISQIQKRRNETLSDIVEASNECSSRTNFEDRNHKSSLMLNQIPEQYESTPSIVAVKTHDFQRNKQKFQNIDELERKRSNSLRESNEDGPQSVKINVFDDEIEQDKAASAFLETSCPSINSKIIERQEKIIPKPTGNLRNISIFVILILFSIVAFYSKALHLDNAFASFKNIKKKKDLKDRHQKPAANTPQKAKSKARDVTWSSTGQDEDDDRSQTVPKKQGNSPKKSKIE